ncbi:DUF2235 domain-containing protein [Amycolatopsis sp. GM8]|uniref:DUF2235 domain-containing protein n=1 Tax=Amycolatopsis sp. GM8 TaxID=2896530 RepID=UPI001F2D1008|nr:DUF2235 domain-containing protein [Amycolatopsis sp. GM8]
MAKRIVICCDGTWNSRKQPAPTNVVRISDALAKRDDQLVNYHEGVGNQWYDRFLGGAFGFGLSHNVRDAYRFVAEHYEPGDELFLFGYSRGAYTARSTVGFIRNCGVLRREELGRIDEAYTLYRDRDPSTHPTEAEATRFRKDYAVEDVTPIRFIGVWDTVGALGIPVSGLPLVGLINRQWQFHDTKLTKIVASAFQALAIDEQRGPFVPAIWQPDDAPEQEREQVWFAGCHGDVGGGVPDPTLSEITLLWMMEQARRCGLVFEPGTLPQLDADAALRAVHNSRTSYYKLLKPFVRTLGVTDSGHEYVSFKTVERTERDHSYAPQNLLAYLRGEPQYR